MTPQYLDVEIATANIPNKNNRTYPLSVLQQIVDTTDEIYGELGPTCSNDYDNWIVRQITQVDMQRVSHKVNNLRLEDNQLIGDVISLNTPCGHILTQLMEDVPISFRPRGIGVLTEGQIISDFKLIAIDAGNE